MSAAVPAHVALWCVLLAGAECADGGGNFLSLNVAAQTTVCRGSTSWVSRDCQVVTGMLAPAAVRVRRRAALTVRAVQTDARKRLDPALVGGDVQQRRRALLRKGPGGSALQGLESRHRVRIDRVCRPRQHAGRRGLTNDGGVFQPDAREPHGRGVLQCYSVGILHGLPCRVHGTPSTLCALSYLRMWRTARAVL